MTDIKRTLKRETPVSVRDAGRLRPVIVELHPQDPCMYLRQKGCRKRYALPYGVAYLAAVKLAVEQQRRMAKAVKKEKTCR